ncbi:helix-turn-helix domain-containing protein [Streptomyces sp. KL118A]|uniref:helix-turn-helix domain-containing protein n=1 Tax=Streptomyces sp. KL118A TaxID=3045153 RepID=UPI00278C7640|nr:helix-turn-helix domain-containing protein [Streptomyces sp. KL118A]
MPTLHEAAGEEKNGPEAVFSLNTDVLPARDRFNWWVDMVGNEVVPVSVRSPHVLTFNGRADFVELPESQVQAFSFSPMTARRSPLQIRRSDPEACFLILARGGPIRLEQGRNIACLGAGDMSLYSTSHPLMCDFLEYGQQTRLTLMRLPRSVLPMADDGVHRLLAASLSARTGAARLLAPYLNGLPEAARSCGPRELDRIGRIGLDLVSTVLAAQLGVPDALPAETRKAVLLARIDAFIDHHLGDPELRPAAVAAAHHISLRSLHALFRDRPETVAASIRRRRVERCHAELSDPALRHRTVAEIAVRWGFRHPADFSRLFRTVHGVPPSAVRPRARDAKDACADC